MTEEEKIQTTALLAAKQKSLELLYDYTKFHIGAYLILTGAYITVATAKFSGVQIVKPNIVCLWTAVVMFMISGLAGGTIISSLTQTQARSSEEFLEEAIGPWALKICKGRSWTYLEHTSFWIGLIAAVLSFALRGG